MAAIGLLCALINTLHIRNTQIGFFWEKAEYSVQYYVIVENIEKHSKQKLIADIEASIDSDKNHIYCITCFEKYLLFLRSTKSRYISAAFTVDCNMHSIISVLKDNRQCFLKRM